MDNLTRDVIEAERLGYGCHYGHYKAACPRAETEAPEECDPALRACAECGTLFRPVRKNHVYCCEECGNRARHRGKYQRITSM